MPLDNHVVKVLFACQVVSNLFPTFHSINLSKYSKLISFVDTFAAR